VKTLKTLIAALCLVTASQGAFAQDTKIGVLNALQALFNSDAARIVQEELEQEFSADEARAQ
jgi:Skp family chaperone for outer membrane proteins